MRVLTLLLTVFLSHAVVAEEMQAKLSLDRSWGLLIGDIIEARLTLPVSVDTLEQDALPQSNKRYGPWLFLLAQEKNGNQLTLRYQIINVPKENRQLMTPEMQLRTLSDDFISVPAVTFQTGSFLPLNATPADLTPRSDTQLTSQSTAAEQNQLFTAVSVLLLSSLIWLLWQFGIRPRQRLPFAAALFELTKMRWLRRKDADTASRSLHKAFNRTAGSVVVYSQLEILMQQAPWLLPLKAEIADFYQQSANHFFSRGGAQQKSFNDIVQLAKSCRAKERVA